MFGVRPKKREVGGILRVFVAFRWIVYHIIDIFDLLMSKFVLFA